MSMGGSNKTNLTFWAVCCTPSVEMKRNMMIILRDLTNWHTDPDVVDIYVKSVQAQISIQWGNVPNVLHHRLVATFMNKTKFPAINPNKTSPASPPAKACKATVK